MRTHNKRYLRTLWMGLTLILPFVYLYQIAPHAHDAHAEPHPHKTSTSPNHTHSHDGSDNEQPDPAHHHHELTNHLDTHVILLQNPRLNSDTGISVGIVAADLGILDRENKYWTPDRFEPPPKFSLIVASGPRAPPLQG